MNFCALLTESAAVFSHPPSLSTAYGIFIGGSSHSQADRSQMIAFSSSCRPLPSPPSLYQPGQEGVFTRSTARAASYLITQACRLKQHNNSISLQPPEILSLCTKHVACVCVLRTLFISLPAVPVPHGDSEHGRPGVCICVCRWQECQVGVSGRRVIIGCVASLQVCLRVAYIFYKIVIILYLYVGVLHYRTTADLTVYAPTKSLTCLQDIMIETYS